MPDLAGVRTGLIALVLGLGIGFASGLYTESQFVKADQVKQANKDRAVTVKEAASSQATSTKIDTAIDESNSRVEKVRTVIVTRIQKQEKESEAKNCPSLVLDTATVRMLNDLRQGFDFDPATIGNAEGQTPSDVTLSQFTDNDIQVVKLYNELAIRHNELVNWVQEKIINQQQ